MSGQKQRRGTALPGAGGGPKAGDLAHRLLGHLRSQSFVTAGNRLGVAVSGGADSVALLGLLLELREQLGVVLSVVHFNHKLRGKSSEADQKFVARLASKHGLPFLMGSENVAAKAKRERANLEEAARRSRYAFFARLVSEGQVDRIAVAHTADDQAETVLAHILRGTGLAGLAGIHPQAGVVFRPLLKVRRAELRAYLASRQQSWREDVTNRDLKRTRARIRHRLMPVLEKQFQPAVVEHLCGLAELAREDQAWLESSAQLRVFLSAREEKGGGWRVPIKELIGAGEELRGAPVMTEQLAPESGPYKHASGRADDRRSAARAMSKRMIRLLVKQVKPRSGQVSAVHVEAVLHLAQQADNGKAVELPGGVEVRRVQNSLCFRTKESAADAETRGKPYAHALELGAGETELRVVEHSWALCFRVIDWPAQGRETKETGAVLDRDKLRAPLVVRNWRSGDALRPLGHQKSHRLSRLLNEVGVSRWEKRSWPVLTSGGKIAWTRGLPVAAEFAVGGTTRAGVVITEVSLT